MKCPEYEALEKLRSEIQRKKKSKSKLSDRKHSKAYTARDSDSRGGYHSDDTRDSETSRSRSEDEDAHIGALEDGDDEAWIAESDTIDRENDLIGPKDNQIPSVKKHKWIADTGATSHMSGNQKLFIDLRPINSDRCVKTGGGRLDIKGVGTVKLIDAHHSRINLVNVLYVPDLPVNLLSVTV
jgi:hypothetical protein